MLLTIKTPLLRAMIEKRHAHARRCKDFLGDCHVCKQNVKFFAGVPSPILSEALQEIQRPPLRIKMLEIAEDNLLNALEGHTIDTSRKSLHDMMRAFRIFKLVKDARSTDERIQCRK
jgi:hypothetical protein